MLLRRIASRAVFRPATFTESPARRIPTSTSVPQARTFFATRPSRDAESQQPQEQSVAEPRAAAETVAEAEAGAGAGAEEGIPLLDAPWQLEDLRSFEIEAFKKYGPSFLQRFNPEERRDAWRRKMTRAKTGQKMAAALGPNWYAMLKEAQALETQETRDLILADKKKLRARVAELRAEKYRLEQESRQWFRSVILPRRAAALEEVKRRHGITSAPGGSSDANSPPAAE